MNKRDVSYLRMAFELARQSYAIRKKVGCLIVDYSKDVPRIVSDGVNGTLPGYSNHCEYTEGAKAGTTRLGVVHAEHNALHKIQNVGVSNCTMYLTTAPCVECAKKIIMDGRITRIVFNAFYKDYEESFDLLRHAKIKLEYLELGDFSTDEFDLSGKLRRQGMSEEAITKYVMGRLNV